jgi:hypothetical protein
MRNKMIKGLVYLIEGECNKLGMLYPSHNLLKYVLSNKDEIKNFRKVKISGDFIKNFLPNPELFLKREYNSDEKYEEVICLAYQITLKNYLIALRKAVGKAKKRINLN